VNTVTTEAIRDAFRTAILGITPTAAPLQSILWSFVASPRAGGRSHLPAATRNFDLIFRNAMPTYEWVGGIGTAYKITLAVCTSYAGVEPETRDHVKAQDAVDLRRALRRLLNVGPTQVDGLVDVRVIGEANERETESTYYVEHTFEVHYHQATV